MDLRPQNKTRYPAPRRKKRGNNHGVTGTGNDFMNRMPLAQALRSTINQTHESEMLPHSNGHHHPDKVAAYRIRKDIYQLHIQQKANLPNI